MTDITVVLASSRRDPALPPTVSPLRIVIPGGEGHLGRILATCLSERGHLVTTLSRSAGRVHESDENLKSLAGEEFERL